MNLGEEILRLKQIVTLSSITLGYHLARSAGDLIDGEEGVIAQRVSQLAGRGLLAHLDLRVAVEGAGRVEGLKRYAIASNHASYLDWAVLLGYFPSPLRIIAKKELISMPMIGSYLGTRGVLIDRKNGIDARQAIAAAAVDEQPWPILIFPEGTRSVDGTVQPFKPGGLKILVEAGRDIVPVSIRGTHEAFPRNARTIRPGGDIRVVIGEAVHPHEYATPAEAIAEVERRVRAGVAG